MTDSTTLPDPRAQAAADKAYRKASRPWFKKKRFLFPLILVLLIIIITATSGGKKDATPGPAPAPAASTTPAPDAAPAYLGAEPGDVSGQAGAALKIGDATATSTPLKAGKVTPGLDTPTLCTTVTLNNGSKQAIMFTAMDWKLQTPSGMILNTGFWGSGNLLTTGEFAPGGTASGDVCFDNKNDEAGQFVVLYEPVFSFFSDRAAWINAL